MSDELPVQLSLVSHYGKKSDSVSDLIVMLQDRLSGTLGFAFKPYGIEQVHGTIIGLEGVPSDKGIINRWYLDNQQEERIVDTEKLIRFIQSDKIEDIEIKIGGWEPHAHYDFYSNSQHPYMRSFSIQGEIAVAMGWPFDSGQYSERLYKMRKRFEEINVLHKWNKHDYRDNDFFFVIGRVLKKYADPLVFQQLANEIRILLSGVDERIIIGKDTISLVAYVDARLPLDTTRSFDLRDPMLTSALIDRLYEQGIQLN